MLRCPVCVKTEMVVLELDAVEVDHCLECGGVWLDAGELELLIGAPDRLTTLTTAFSDLQKTTTEKAHPCPICGKRMQKFLSGSDATTVTLDRCPAGHGIWFDDGELHTVLACGCGADDRVVSLVREMFKARMATNTGEKT